MITPPVFVRRSLWLACVLPLASFAADAPPLTGHEPIEIPNSRGSFDLLQVDVVKHRLLLAHTGNGTLDIIDLKTEKLLKQIKTGAVMDTASDAKKNRYYASAKYESVCETLLYNQKFTFIVKYSRHILSSVIVNPHGSFQ